jgi:REP element-mobilizing transposase RayT
MPRGPRIELAGGVHHVTARTPSGRLFFHEDLDRRRYLDWLGAEARDRMWSILSYCLMSNHVHLLLHTPAPDLGAGLKRVHQAFAESVNRNREQHGHLFGARFHNAIVRDDAHLLACLRYIARNPVEAAMCARPEHWPWSAHRMLVGLAPAPRFLDVSGVLGLIADDPSEARAVYADLTAQPDASLIATLREAEPDTWLATAVDQFEVSVADLASYLGATPRTVYRWLAVSRVKKGTDPSVTCERPARGRAAR